MALATHSQLHFPSGSSLKVVETIAQITAMLPPAPPLAVWPSGILAQTANGEKVWVSLSMVEWIEPL